MWLFNRMTAFWQLDSELVKPTWLLLSLQSHFGSFTVCFASFLLGLPDHILHSFTLTLIPVTPTPKKHTQLWRHAHRKWGMLMKQHNGDIVAAAMQYGTIIWPRNSQKITVDSLMVREKSRWVMICFQAIRLEVFYQLLPPTKAHCLIVCVSTWLVQSLSVPVEAAMVADNAN